MASKVVRIPDYQSWGERSFTIGHEIGRMFEAHGMGEHGMGIVVTQTVDAHDERYDIYTIEMDEMGEK